jgi:hypothetical protein
MNRVTWQPKALKQLKKLGDKAVQGRILAATATLSAFPDVANVKALAAISIVRIEEVKKRNERTY